MITKDSMDGHSRQAFFYISAFVMQDVQSRAEPRRASQMPSERLSG